MASSAGNRLSPPSTLKRFWPTNFFWRNSSKTVAWLSFLKICFFSASLSTGRLASSMWSLNHPQRSGSRMYMYSMPIEWQ